MFDYPGQPHYRAAHLEQLALSSPFQATLASIIKFPPPDVNKGPLSYSQLSCSEQDKAFIYELITVMAENGKVSLLFKQSHLKQLGAQINHVHPLKFLSTVFTNSHLTTSMTEIFDDYFKRTGFMEGLGTTLTREAEKGKLELYINDFAAEISVPLEVIQKHFHSRDWEGLVRSLMNTNS